MAEGGVRGRALCLILILLLSGPISNIGEWDGESNALVEMTEINIPFKAIAGDSTTLHLDANNPDETFTIELADDEPLVDAHIKMRPDTKPLHTGFTWDSSSTWSHPNANTLNQLVPGNILKVTTPLEYYDFSTGLQGWSSSSSTYVKHYSSGCGSNGSASGAVSIQADGQQSLTSPPMNLLGQSNMEVHAWILQGSSACGEEPDSNEDLKIEYKNASGNWITLHTVLGSSSGGTALDFNQSLPADAYHPNFQLRFRQTSGSGTSFDFYFLDDVRIFDIPIGTWTSPTIGWASDADEKLPFGQYQPIFLDADIPMGSELGWSIVDEQGQDVYQLGGVNDLMIPANMLDWRNISKFRLKLTFDEVGTGNVPMIYSISGDGSFSEGFYTDPSNRDWDYNNATWNANNFTVIGNAYNGITSPYYDSFGPLDSLEVSAVSHNLKVETRYQRDGTWQPVSLPLTLQSTGEEFGIQLRFTPQLGLDGNKSNFTYWQLFSAQINLFTGEAPANPRIDFTLDGINEWGGVDARIGRWGWQDHFANGKESVQVNPGLQTFASSQILIPRDNIQSLSFGISSQQSTLDEVSLYIGTDLIGTWSYDNARTAFITLNSTQFNTLKTSASANSQALGALGEMFIAADIEIQGTGNFTLSALSAPYLAGVDVEFDAQSTFILGFNSARSNIAASQGVQAVPLPIISDTTGSLHIELVSFNSSSEVILLSSQLLNPQATLTPGQTWQSFECEYEVLSSTANLVRVDLVGQNNHATWFIPLNGGTPVGQGDSHLLELHPSDGLTIVENGISLTTVVKFRVEPSWDDEELLTLYSSVILASGTGAIPGVHVWGGAGVQGYENDLEIHSLTFIDADGVLNASDYYIRAGEPLTITADIGFEGIDSSESFVEGDARVEILRNGKMIANTTSLTADMWTFTELIPYSHGEANWTIRVVPISGSGITEDSEIIRPLFIDASKPRVIDSNIAWYDHRIPSTTQTISVQIMDSPVLPTNISAMIWKEWVDDANSNSLPDPGEYTLMAVTIPQDLTDSIGQYKLLIDDSNGDLGDKVAGYLIGTDDAGFSLLDGGSSEPTEHLFMYQLAEDGSPEVESDALTWQDGRKSWLHPHTSYSINLDLNEPNGASDLATVEFMLANSQVSDQMKVTWDFKTGNCTTLSEYIILDDCEMRNQDGGIAGPFDQDLTLSIDFSLTWAVPDLGQTRREPALRVIDSAGQSELKTFPENRWRFSTAMAIPTGSVNLHLTSGSLTEDGARMGPGTPFEVSGELVFEETGIAPEFDCDIELQLGGQSVFATAKNGIWSTPINALGASGKVPLTWYVACLPPQGVDATDLSESVEWINIDGYGPEPVEVLSPRPGSTLDAEEHEVRIILSEEGEIDPDSLELVWWVEDKYTGDQLRNGREAMTLVGEEVSGLRLEAVASMNLSQITDDMLTNQLVLVIRVDGRDMAGNEVLGMQGTPAGSAVARWNMEFLEPVFELTPTSVGYSRLLVEVGQTTSIQIQIKNTGSLSGVTGVTITQVETNGERSLIQATTIKVGAGQEGLVTLDWGPDRSGLQWVEVTLDNGETASGPSIDVRAQRELSFTEELFGDVNPLLGTFVALLVISIITTGLLLAKKTTQNKGSDEELDWDEYSSEIEEELDEESYSKALPELDNASTAQVAISPAAQATADAVSKDWVEGADGMMWYHDKASGEWWYKDSEGNVVKHS